MMPFHSGHEEKWNVFFARPRNSTFPTTKIEKEAQHVEEREYLLFLTGRNRNNPSHAQPKKPRYLYWSTYFEPDYDTAVQFYGLVVVLLYIPVHDHWSRALCQDNRDIVRD